MNLCKSRGHPKDYPGRCKKCVVENVKLWRQRHPEKFKKYRRAQYRLKTNKLTAQLKRFVVDFLNCWEVDARGGHTLPRESLPQLQQLIAKAKELGIDRRSKP